MSDMNDFSSQENVGSSGAFCHCFWWTDLSGNDWSRWREEAWGASALSAQEVHWKEVGRQKSADISWLFLMGFALTSFDMNKPVYLHVPVRRILLIHIQLAEGEPVFKIMWREKRILENSSWKLRKRFWGFLGDKVTKLCVSYFSSHCPEVCSQAGNEKSANQKPSFPTAQNSSSELHVTL